MKKAYSFFLWYACQPPLKMTVAKRKNYTQD